jgi:uncharacterized membrane protein YeiH
LGKGGQAPANETMDEFQLPRALDYIATWTWATTGAVVGLRKRFDITGVFVVALLSSMGGGLMRDTLFLQRQPLMLTDPVYLPLVLVATVTMSLFARTLTRLLSPETLRKGIDLVDAVGIPGYAVVGMQLAQQQGLPVAGTLFVGVVNGVAGGFLRDMVVGEVPALLRPGQFTTLSLLAVCGSFLILERLGGIPSATAAWTVVAMFFGLRVVAVRFNWQTQAVWRDDSESRD